MYHNNGEPIKANSDHETGQSVNPKQNGGCTDIDGQRTATYSTTSPVTLPPDQQPSPPKAIESSIETGNTTAENNDLMKDESSKSEVSEFLSCDVADVENILQYAEAEEIRLPADETRQESDKVPAEVVGCSAELLEVRTTVSSITDTERRLAASVQRSAAITVQKPLGSSMALQTLPILTGCNPNRTPAASGVGSTARISTPTIGDGSPVVYLLASPGSCIRSAVGPCNGVSAAAAAAAAVQSSSQRIQVALTHSSTGTAMSVPAGPGIPGVPTAAFTFVPRTQVVNVAAAGSMPTANCDVRPVFRLMQFTKRSAGPLNSSAISGTFPSVSVTTASSGIVPGGIQLMPARALVSRATFDVRNATGSAMVFAPAAQPAAGLTFLPLHQFPLRPPPQQQQQTVSGSVTGSTDQTPPVSFSAEGLVRLATLQPQLVPVGGIAVTLPGTGLPGPVLPAISGSPQLAGASAGPAGFGLVPSSAAAFLLSRLAATGNVFAAASPRSSLPPGMVVAAAGLRGGMSTAVAGSAPSPSQSGILNGERPLLANHMTVTTSNSISLMAPNLLRPVRSPTATSPLALSSSPSTTTLPSSSESSSGISMVTPSCSITTKQTVQEKNAYEYERVMDILRYYRELVVERKLPGACLPCKRRKSKPLVSVSSASQAASLAGDESPPLPIPLPPPPPLLVSSVTEPAKQTNAAAATTTMVFTGLQTAVARQPPAESSSNHNLAVSVLPQVHGVGAIGLGVSQTFPAVASIASTTVSLQQQAGPRLFLQPTPSVTSTAIQQPTARPTIVSLPPATSATSACPGMFPISMTSWISAAGSCINSPEISIRDQENSKADARDSVLSTSPEQNRPRSANAMFESTSMTQHVPRMRRSMSLSSLKSYIAMHRSIMSGNAVDDQDMEPAIFSVHSKESEAHFANMMAEGDSTCNDETRTSGLSITTSDHSLAVTTPYSGGTSAVALSPSKADRNAHEAVISSRSPSSSSLSQVVSTTAELANGSSVGMQSVAMVDSAETAGMSRKRRHLSSSVACDDDFEDDDVTSCWPEITGDESVVLSTDAFNSGGEISLDLGHVVDQFTYSNGTTRLNTERHRQSFHAAVKSPGRTLTTLTFVTKWTASRLAVSGPYQSWC